jgi:hypothetical protein
MDKQTYDQSKAVKEKSTNSTKTHKKGRMDTKEAQATTQVQSGAQLN